jgi:hypothetical protein
VAPGPFKPWRQILVLTPKDQLLFGDTNGAGVKIQRKKKQKDLKKGMCHLKDW